MIRILIVCIFLLTSLLAHSQEKRLALVIGNSAYEHGGVLRNPVNDAVAMSNALQQLGFDVLLHKDLGQSNMKRAIDEFGQKLSDYDVGLFFYAGHGIQARGYNYLIPVDANLISEQQVEYDCVQADRVLALMDAAQSDVNIIILDACRNNPFERSWTRSSTSGGLAFMNAPSGSLIAYSTAPGQTASDGKGTNSTYTRAMLESIAIPGLTILQTFQNVRSLVQERSGDQQIPWESTSLVGNFYFIKGDMQDRDAILSTTKADLQETAPTGKYAGPSGLFTDDRDGMNYVWIRYGEQVWMGENLNYEAPDSYCYKEKDSNCKKYGRLYNWKTAQSVCPDGWRLPGSDDWNELEAHLITELPDSIGSYDPIDLTGGMLKSVGWKSPNRGVRYTTGFAALPAGMRQYDVKASPFAGLGEMTFYWTIDIHGAFEAYALRLYYKEGGMDIAEGHMNNHVSVRCIRDE